MVTINRDNLSDQVARYLQGYMRDHNLRPGDPLPSEAEVCRALGVSRGIVREAFRSLAAAGLIEVSSGRRAQVRALSDASLTQLLQHAVATEQVTPGEILELRRTVEVGAAQLAASRRRPEDVEAIREAVKQMEKVLRDADRFVAHDFEFHVAIARATQNPLFTVLIRSLRKPIEDSIREGLRSRDSDQAWLRIQDLHTRILQAIVAGDPAQAGRFMELHFDDAISAVLAYGKKRPGASNMDP